MIETIVAGDELRSACKERLPYLFYGSRRRLAASGCILLIVLHTKIVGELDAATRCVGIGINKSYQTSSILDGFLSAADIKKRSVVQRPGFDLFEIDTRVEDPDRIQQR